jgi:predicted nuclease of predicted toxin-antitoxin system
MRFLCDVHIPIRLVKWLIAQNHEAQHVNRLPDSFHPDRIVVFGDSR